MRWVPGLFIRIRHLQTDVFLRRFEQVQMVAPMRGSPILHRVNGDLTTCKRASSGRTASIFTSASCAAAAILVPPQTCKPRT